MVSTWYPNPMLTKLPGLIMTFKSSILKSMMNTRFHCLVYHLTSRIHFCRKRFQSGQRSPTLVSCTGISCELNWICQNGSISETNNYHRFRFLSFKHHTSLLHIQSDTNEDDVLDMIKWKNYIQYNQSGDHRRGEKREEK